MCLYPRLINNPRYKENQKNGGIIPPINDIRTTVIPIGCNNCIECRKQKARDWQVRLQEEIKTNKGGKFITLTFNTKSLNDIGKNINLTGYNKDNAIATRAVRLFLERWRKEHKISLRHWLITELGHQNTEHVHLHGIIWFKHPQDILKLETIWKYGWVWRGQPIITNKNEIIGYRNYVNNTTVNYITKYVYKTDIDHKEFKSIILTSSGIGGNYINAKFNKYNGEETQEYYKTNTGNKISLPIYYRNKIYTEDQREKLWIQKLNKEVRYINGNKIDIKKTIQNISRPTKIRKRNK